MNGLITTIVAFIVALGILISVHEYGHFWVARRLGVKVLRFSIGFGKPLWRRVGRDGVEYVVAALPLGGYVRMLDEREGPVPREASSAFNRQSLWVRSAMVVAGPMFNFLFAIVAFWGVMTLGETGLSPLIGQVLPQLPAARSELQPGDEILTINGRATPTWSLAMQELATASLSEPVLNIRVRDAAGSERVRVMPFCRGRGSR